MSEMQKYSSLHSFEVDTAIIFDLIHAQNGTFPTGLRELIMNSIDAKATSCKISLGLTEFIVEDNGIGFSGRESVMEHFKRFGSPHQEGDAKYGRFRIGRGQIMAFGKIKWHSNQYQMITDVKHNGTNFEFIEDLKDQFAGCIVSGELYEPLKTYEVRTAIDEIKKLVRYVDIDVTVNGISVVSQQPAWDYEDEEIKIKWNPNRHGIDAIIRSIQLYSQGVYVKEIPNHLYALDGVIVTKKALSLNMARNEINTQDPLWIKIESIVKQRSIDVEQQEMKSRRRFDDSTRRAMINKFKLGILSFDQIVAAPLLRDCRGQYFDISKLFSRTDTTKTRLTISPEAGSRIAERIATQKIAVVLHSEECRTWGVSSVEDLISMFKTSTSNETYLRRLNRIIITDFSVVSKGFDQKMTIISDKTLTSRESAAKQAIQYGSDILLKKFNSDASNNRRKIVIGESTSAEGWTDGKTFIAIERSMLSLLDRGIPGAVQLMLLVLHEYLHDTSDVGSHFHDFSFYESYHDLTSEHSHSKEKVGTSAECLFERYLGLLINKNEALPNPAIKRFKYPIINDIAQYDGELSKPFSNLATFLLNSSGATWSAKKKYFSLSINDKSAQTFISNLRQIMANIMAADGYRLTDFESMRYQHGWEKAIEICNTNDLPILNEWSDKNGHDRRLVELIIIKRVRNFSEFLGWLCIDSNSGLVGVKQVSLFPQYHFITADCQFSIRTANTCYLAKCKPDWFAERQNRFSFALQGIKDIVNCLSDADKRIFCEQYFSSQLTIQVNVPSFSYFDL